MLKFDGPWLVQDSYAHRLYEAGYGVHVAEQVHAKGVAARYLYVLKNLETREIVLETTDPKELNNMVKLLLPPED